MVRLVGEIKRIDFINVGVGPVTVDDKGEKLETFCNGGIIGKLLAGKDADEEGLISPDGFLVLNTFLSAGKY